MASVATTPLLDGEELVRRFNPDDPSHVDNLARDEGNGEVRLRGGALRFDLDGCSVYRIEVLATSGLSMRDVATPEYSALATTRAEQVRAVRSGFVGSAHEFEVHASPLAPPPEHNPAHASIVQVAIYPSNSKRRQAVDALAARAFEVVDLRGVQV